MRPTQYLPLLALVATAGCNLGWGTPYPGAATRYREFYRCSAVAGSWCYDPVKDSETGGGGAHGYVVGMSMGTEAGDVAGRSAGGIAFDVRGEYRYSLTKWASVGAFAGVGFTAGSIDSGDGGDMDPKLGVRRIPLGGKLMLVPTPPLIFTAGAFVAPTTLRIDEGDSVSTTAYGWSAGGGLSLPFPGLHLVLMFEWQHHRGSDVTVDAMTGRYGSDVYLASYWLVL